MSHGGGDVTCSAWDSAYVWVCGDVEHLRYIKQVHVSGTPASQVQLSGTVTQSASYGCAASCGG